ncbi:hypothetical protein QYE76_061080 [Lolium multiflorum]|uniref:F-box domain-containing protein n=1 Tax=Lolium multiflorum TaxID=4521 RepID=A0AAD8S2I8_LOLMU|nr:hypothetical protein QYE76_061080 [Lolium multiflorum]
MEEVISRLPPVLMDELVEEVLLRLPPDEPPTCFVRSSAVCKPWRRILAAPRFRRRYGEFHGTPPFLGYFRFDATFVPTSALVPAQPDRPDMISLDCRHGRVLLATSDRYMKPFELVVLEPLTGHESHVPSPMQRGRMCSASVLCAAQGQGCNHHTCQGEHFLVALVSTDWQRRVTSGWLYSSETRVWSELTSLHHPNVKSASYMGGRSVLVGDALYFNVDVIIKCQLGTLSLSRFEKPIDVKGCLMSLEDGELGFAAVVDVRVLTLWSMQTGPEGALGWVKFRLINLEMLLPDGALLTPTHEYGISSVSGFAEGTQVMFVSTYVGCYMVDLKSGRVRMVSCFRENILPYMRFNFPAMEAASMDQEL